MHRGCGVRVADVYALDGRGRGRRRSASTRATRPQRRCTSGLLASRCVAAQRHGCAAAPASTRTATPRAITGRDGQRTDRTTLVGCVRALLPSRAPSGDPPAGMRGALDAGENVTVGPPECVSHRHPTPSSRRSLRGSSLLLDPFVDLVLHDASRRTGDRAGRDAGREIDAARHRVGDDVVARSPATPAASAMLPFSPISAPSSLGPSGERHAPNPCNSEQCNRARGPPSTPVFARQRDIPSHHVVDRLEIVGLRVGGQGFTRRGPTLARSCCCAERGAVVAFPGSNSLSR